jgi:hypothetical protein
VVVEVGLTLGFAEVEVNPLGLDVQEYITPVTAVKRKGDFILSP